MRFRMRFMRFVIRFRLKIEKYDLNLQSLLFEIKAQTLPAQAHNFSIYIYKVYENFSTVIGRKKLGSDGKLRTGVGWEIWKIGLKFMGCLWRLGESD